MSFNDPPLTPSSLYESTQVLDTIKLNLSSIRSHDNTNRVVPLEWVWAVVVAWAWVEWDVL